MATIKYYDGDQTAGKQLAKWRFQKELGALKSFRSPSYTKS